MQLFLVPTTKDESGALAAPTLIDDLHKSFKDWGIKEDGVALQLREPGKKGSAYWTQIWGWFLMENRQPKSIFSI